MKKQENAGVVAMLGASEEDKKVVEEETGDDGGVALHWRKNHNWKPTESSWTKPRSWQKELRLVFL